jgi:hypothetical protein
MVCGFWAKGDLEDSIYFVLPTQQNQQKGVYSKFSKNQSFQEELNDKKN